MNLPVGKSSEIIPVAEPLIGDAELKNVTECIRSGWISSLGRYIDEFERGFAEFCNTKYGVATSNGTTALHLALVTLGIGPGDEVLVPSLTFAATANVVAYTGAKPIFVDSEPETWNMSADDLKAKITDKTKAIIVVHLYGHPADMGAICEIANSQNIPIIEDAAEAHGARYRSSRVGSFGLIACFSFYGNKIITTGEGGMLVTSDPNLSARSKHLRDHAMDPKRRYWHDEIGYNYRMTNIQAAIGVAQLEQADFFIARKRDNAALYNSILGESSAITLPPEASWATNVYWMYSILLTSSSRISRDELLARLSENGIGCRPFFYPVHKLPAFQQGGHGEQLAVAEDLSARGLNLPSSVKLSDDDIRRVCAAVLEAV